MKKIVVLLSLVIVLSINLFPLPAFAGGNGWYSYQYYESGRGRGPRGSDLPEVIGAVSGLVLAGATAVRIIAPPQPSVVYVPAPPQPSVVYVPAPPQPAVVYPAHVIVAADPCMFYAGDPERHAACVSGRAAAIEEHRIRARERGYVAGQRGESALVCAYELDPLARSGCDAAWRTGNNMWRDAELARVYHSGYQASPR